MSRVLVVDDDELMVGSYVRALTRMGYGVDTASNGRQAIERFRGHAYDAVLSDLAMPDMDGLEFLRELRKFDLDVPVLIVTGAPSLESAVKALEYGAFRYITKPAKSEELHEALARAIRFHELARLRRLALSLVEQSGHALGDRASLEARFESAMATARIAFQPIVSWTPPGGGGVRGAAAHPGADTAAPGPLHRRGRPPGPPARAGAGLPGQDRDGDRGGRRSRTCATSSTCTRRI